MNSNMKILYEKKLYPHKICLSYGMSGPLIHTVDDAELNKLELSSLIILICGSEHIRYSFN